MLGMAWWRGSDTQGSIQNSRYAELNHEAIFFYTMDSFLLIMCIFLVFVGSIQLIDSCRVDAVKASCTCARIINDICKNTLKKSTNAAKLNVKWQTEVAEFKFFIIILPAVFSGRTGFSQKWRRKPNFLDSCILNTIPKTITYNSVSL